MHKKHKVRNPDEPQWNVVRYLYESLNKKHEGRISPIGESKTVRCSDCGYNNPINAEFCMKCGERLKKREGKDETRIYDNDTNPYEPQWNVVRYLYESLNKKHEGRISPIGESKTVRCSDCGYNNPINAEFCMKCGERLKKREGKDETRIYDVLHTVNGVVS